MRYIFPIVAINRDGSTRLFYNGRDLIDFVNSTKRRRWGDVYVGTEWITSDPLRWYRSDYEPAKNDWILRDDRGRPVDYKVFVSSTPHWKNKKGNFTFRNGPVPGRRHSTPWKMDHTAKKNSGAGHRNRNRALAEYERHEYGIHNRYGKPIAYEGW